MKKNMMLCRYFCIVIFAFFSAVTFANTLKNSAYLSHGGPQIDISVDDKELYYINNKNQIYVLDLASGNVKKLLDDDNVNDANLKNIILSSDGKTGYVIAHIGNFNWLLSLDLVGKNITNSIRLRNASTAMTIDQKRNAIYLFSTVYSNPGSDEERGAHIIDAQLNQIMTISTNPSSDKLGICGDMRYWKFTDLAVSSDEKKLYFVDPGNQSLATLDLMTHTFQLKAIPTINQCPTTVAVNHFNNRLYIGANKTVSVVDTTTDKIISYIPIISYPRKIIISANGKKAYIINEDSNSLSVIDTVSNQIIKNIETNSSDPWSGVSSRDGSKVYITNNGDRTIMVIDTQTDQVVKTFSVRK